MALALVRPDILYAWKGPSLLIVGMRGDCSSDQPISGFYFRKARFLQTLRLEIDGERPWLCETAAVDPESLAFNFVHPEITRLGGGGTGQSQDDEPLDERGIPERSLAGFGRRPRSDRLLRIVVETEAPSFQVQALARDAQAIGRLGLVVARQLQRPRNRRPFHIVVHALQRLVEANRDGADGDRRRRLERRSGWRGIAKRRGQILEVHQFVLVVQRDDAFQLVGELPDVAGPVVGRQPFERLG